MLSSLDGLARLPRMAAPHRAMYLWSKLILSNYILFADRMEMAHGVEVRPVDVLCSDCGARLWSDEAPGDRPCPYMRGGRCDPPQGSW